MPVHAPVSRSKVALAMALVLSPVTLGLMGNSALADGFNVTLPLAETPTPTRLAANKTVKKSANKSAIKQEEAAPGEASIGDSNLSSAKPNLGKLSETSMPFKEKGTATPAIVTDVDADGKDAGLSTKDKLEAVKAKAEMQTQSFQSCRKVALDERQSGSDASLKRRLSVCREHYPLASLFLDCKKKAVATHKSNKTELGEALKMCQKFFASVDFSIKSPYPFFTFNNKLYFAGIGMNASQDSKDLPMPNFDCQGLQDVGKGSANPGFILFGSHPGQFVSDHEKEKFFQALTKPGALGKFARMEGKFIGDKYASDAANLYFPSAPCVYNAFSASGVKAEERIYKAMNLYYLASKGSSQFLPFAAIAFFNPGKAPPLASYIEVLSKRLGEGYEVSNVASSKGFVFFSRERISEFDAEGDPRNLCNEPRIQEFMVALKISGEKKDVIDYILVANIKNYCAYGDAFAQRILRKGGTAAQQ